ncbi:MAG: Uma2 family endonuclease [Jatrophihabitantaceae bacterium]
MPRNSYDWTVDDLDLLPDDGLQYELLDGMLLVTPAPVPNHRRLARGMFRLLDAACPYDRFEVLSPSTRRKDVVLKWSKYEDAGVASYWILDPDGPTVTAADLRPGGYVEVGSVTGEDTLRLELPFPVTVTPSTLV